MPTTQIKQNQFKKSVAPGALMSSDASNFFTITEPTTGADHLWFYDHSATALVPLIVGSNLSISGTTLNASAGAGGYAEIQEEGTPLTARTKFNFIGAGFTAADDIPNTRTNITLDATLNALAAYNTNGILTQTSADTFVGRTLTGTTNRLTITNGDGVSGNPTADISTAYVGQATITTLGTITTGVWNGTTIAVANGGTGLTTGTSGGILGFTAAGTIASSTLLTANAIVLGGGAGVLPSTPLALGTTTQVLHGNAAGAPTWGAVSMTADVSGTLPVTNGGTGATTITGLLQGNGTSPITGITNSSTVGQILRVTGASTYGWGALDLTDTDALSGDLPFASLAQGSALSVLGVTGNATADFASIPASSDNQVLRRSGTALTFGAISLGSASAVSGILAIANGGTGSGTQNFVDLTTGQTIAGAKVFSSNITINGTPSANTDAATVGWVLNNVAGLKSGSVRGATTAALAITARTATTLTIGGTALTVDGVTYANAETILVKDSTTGTGAGTWDNGAYSVSGVGSSIVLTRVAWMDTAGEVDGVYVLIQDGTANVGTLWFTVSEVTTLGTDAISFTQIATAGTIGGTAAANKVAYGSGVNTLTSTTNFHFDGTALAIGTATVPASTILTTQGSGTSDTTFGYRHNNSAATQVFRVADDGTTRIGATNPLVVLNNSIFNLGDDITMAGATSVIIASGGTVAPQGNLIVSASRNVTSGASLNLSITGSFNPTSGTGTNTQLSINTTVNQTGGANGIVRGAHIIPTLTAVADYRALEITTSASHYAMWTTAGKVRHDLGSDANFDTYYRGSGGEMIRLANGTTGQVLTATTSSAPTWGASTAMVTTVCYVDGTGTATYDLDAGVVARDVDGTGFVFTIPTNLDLVEISRNGVVLSRSGTVSRDYTLTSATGVLVLATVLATDETLRIVRRV